MSDARNNGLYVAMAKAEATNPRNSERSRHLAAQFLASLKPPVIVHTGHPAVANEDHWHHPVVVQ